MYTPGNSRDTFSSLDRKKAGTRRWARADFASGAKHAHELQCKFDVVRRPIRSSNQSFSMPLESSLLAHSLIAIEILVLVCMYFVRWTASPPHHWYRKFDISQASTPEAL